MDIKPKYTLSDARRDASLKTEKKFTDREPFLDAFYSALETKEKDKNKLLVYYGVGGIGKTSLRKELGKRIEAEKPDTVWTAIDFDNPSYREQDSVLFVLRNQLNKKYKINFPLFDIAYTVYWQKTHPQTPMTTDNFPLLMGVNIVSEIMRIVGEIPQIGFVPKLSKAFISSSNVFHKWWERKGKKELSNLPSLEPKDISVRLPMFWANDLKDFLKENKKDAVLFLDTYEALWETHKTDVGFFECDEWIRELLSQLPEVIWVICGREKLRWNEQDEEWNNYIEQHLLGSLSNEDSGYFLKSCGIEKTDVQNVIISASKGVPYFLDLAVDTYFEIKTRYQREPAADDFAKTQNDVLERFLKYLDNAEIETLKTLSVARVWDSEIFRLLVKKFRTGYAITEMNNLFRFSFINETGKTGMQTMHDLMSESLESKLDADKLKIIHNVLFDFYNEKLKNANVKNIDENAKQYLIEASYHGKAGLGPGEYFEWFYPAIKTFQDAAQFRLILPMCEDLLKMMETFKEKDSIKYINTLRKLAILYGKIGKYKDSELMFRQALVKIEKTLGTEHLEAGRILNDLAGLLFQLGRFTDAETMYKRSIKIVEKISGRECAEVSNSLNNLAMIYSVQGRYDDAEPLFKLAISIKEKIFGIDHHDVASFLSNLANIYFDLRKLDEAEALFKRSLIIYEKTFGEFHPDIGRTLTLIGNVYLERNKYTEAVAYYLRANEIYKFIYGPEHPDIAIEENNLAICYFKLGKYDEAFSLYIKALKIFQKNLDRNHPNIASTISSLGLLFLKQKKYREAELLFKKALKKRIMVLGTEHLDLVDSYKSFAGLYEEQNHIPEAIQNLEKARKILKKIFSEENSEVIEISKKLIELKNKINL